MDIWRDVADKVAAVDPAAAVVVGKVREVQQDSAGDDGGRFAVHKSGNTQYWILAGLLVVGLYGLMMGEPLAVFLGFGVAAVWCWWSWRVRYEVEHALYPLCLFRELTEAPFISMENKLLNLMDQSAGIPDLFRDGYVSVKCTELDDRRVVFVVSVRDVVGAIEFIEKNADRWAAAFGDRDGADISTLSVNVYRLEFDLLGSRADDVVVEW